MPNQDDELAEVQATILKLQAEIKAQDVEIKAKEAEIEKTTNEIKAQMIRIAKEQRQLEVGQRLLANRSTELIDPNLVWARIEAEGEKAARQQAETLEGLSQDEILEVANRQRPNEKVRRKRRRKPPRRRKSRRR